MNILDVFVGILAVLGLAFLSFKAGEFTGKAQGRKLGYATCVSEQDDDRPTYSRRRNAGTDIVR